MTILNTPTLQEGYDKIFDMVHEGRPINQSRIDKLFSCDYKVDRSGKGKFIDFLLDKGYAYDKETQRWYK